MENYFRPIPLTILDFLAIYIPGIVWGILLTICFPVIWLTTIGEGIFLTEIISYNYMQFIMLDNYTKVAIVFFFPLLIGYSLKPIAMRISDILSRPFFLLREYVTVKAFYKISFPFKEFHDSKVYNVMLREKMKNILGCETKDFNVKDPFTIVKRYLRLTSPPLWEESERFEAEVRMIGALFLASIFSFILSMWVLFYSGYPSIQIYFLEYCWGIVSLVFVFILGDGFNYTREHEVSYTYLNVLLAHGFQKENYDSDKPNPENDEK